MDIKEIQAWRTIVAILQETGYDKLYDEEVHIVTECLCRCKQQCKKQKEVIDKIYELIKQHIRKAGFLELNEWQTRDLLDLLKEV